MTNFFRDLEHELRAAHRRDAAGTLLARLRPSTPRVRTMAALGAAAALLIAAIGLVTVLAETEPERGAVQGGEPPATGPVPDHDPKVPGKRGCGERDPGPAPRPVLDTFAVLRDRGAPVREGTRGYATPDDVRTLFADAERLVERDGRRLLVVPATIGCGSDREEPGVCLGAEGPQTDVDLRCATLAKVEQTGLELRADGRDGVKLAVLVPDGIRAVRIESGRCGSRATVDLPVERNIATTTLLTHMRCAEVVQLVERQNLHSPDTAP